MSHIGSWQSMETAPKSCNILLVREGNPRTVTFGYWLELEHGPQIGNCGGECRCPEYDDAPEPFWFSEDGGFTQENPPIAWAQIPDAPPLSEFAELRKAEGAA